MPTYKSGKFMAEKIKYPDGIGCCIWKPFEGLEDAGIAWDFEYDDIDEIIELLELLKMVPADRYSVDDDRIYNGEGTA